jgi:hypothetical protein
VVRTASPPARGSNSLIFRSLHVVASKVPIVLNAIHWIASLCPLKTDLGASVFARSHSLTVYSPDALARTFDAVGWKSTWPTLRGDASMRATGSKSHGSQCSWPHPSKVECSTFQIMTFPSSPPDATIESLWGDQSVSSTGAVWDRAKGITSGSLYGRLQGNGWNGDGKGRMANAPPPDAFQLTLIYRYSARSDTLCHRDRSGRAYPRGRDDIGIPSTVGHLHIFDTMLFLARLSKDMAIFPSTTPFLMYSKDNPPIFRGSNKARHGGWD